MLFIKKIIPPQPCSLVLFFFFFFFSYLRSFVMSRKSNGINETNLFSTSIKLEHDTDDQLIGEENDFHSTSTYLNPSLSSAYKGKIEVTSKGRRKIFDGVRWQILCRRPDCRKQTNKKSLCITHYKEEYEPNIPSSSRSNPSLSFPLSSYQQQQQHSSRNENQNNTITSTDITENDEQILFSSNTRSIRDGYIKYMHGGRRFLFKNSKWLPLCKYDQMCRSLAKYQSLCTKHYELNEEKRREAFKRHGNQKDKTKRLKGNDFPMSSSSLIEQFDINSNENSCSSTEPVQTNFSTVTSKRLDHEFNTSSTKHLNTISTDYSSFKKSNPSMKTDQSVQTDITIPLCCLLHQEDHSFSSSCINKKSTSSIPSYNAKLEPQSFDTSFSI